jgi:hypothetical protein
VDRQDRPESGDYTVRFIVLLGHPRTAADVAAVESLGGRIVTLRSTGYTVDIDDARIPDVRALPGVGVTEFQAVLCVG